MSYYENAVRLKPFIEKAIISLSDTDALQSITLYPKWKIDTNYEVGIRVQYNNVLYKCVQAHISQDNWSPELTPALWAAVSVDNGTQNNPITAVRGMEYEEEKYYLDTEDNNIYVCTRSGVLQYMPHELVGHYFNRCE